MESNWTGERLETSIFSRDAIEHLHRYAIVTNYVFGKKVLDIACGEGYGSFLMSDKAALVYGVDIDSDSIAKAKVKYNKSNIKYKIGSTDKIPLDDSCVDVVVSFETIEHHDKHNKMMLEIKRVLKPKGLLIISTPDKLHYSDERNFKNRYHIKELYKNEFVKLVSTYFDRFQLLNQIYFSGNSFIQENEDLNVYSGNFEKVNSEKRDPLYLVAIASDVVFEKQKKSIFDGSLLIEKEVKENINKIYKSNTYKVGHILLSPLKFLKRLFN